MKTKARIDSIRKRQKIEEKYSWDRVSDSEEERHSHKIRAIIAAISITAVFVLFVFKLYELQVTNHEYYLVKAENNRIKIRPIQAPRGLIYDRNGKEIAKNFNTFDLIAKKERVKNKKVFFDNLEKVLSIDKREREIIEAQFSDRKLKDITIKENISLEEFSKISVDQHVIPELELMPKLKRKYLHPLETSHVVGYVSKVSENDLDSKVVKIYEGMTDVGKIGIERFYQNLLVGEPGFERLETDVQGEIIRTLKTNKPKRGLDIYLTIDLDLQIYAYELMKEKEGAIVVMNPKNGDILTFVSAPGYDTNLFTKSISTKDYQELLTREERPLINRVIAGQYPPGSTLKPFVGLIALDEDIIDDKTSFNCSGSYKLKNNKRPFGCWKKEGHGGTDLSYGLTQSCDVFFYRVAELTGIDIISDEIDKYGFGERTYIDLLGEASGLIPDRAWKRRVKGLPWYPGETLNVGIGQGFFLATPIQLALATSIIANDGQTFTPHLLLGYKDIKTNEYKKYEYEQNKYEVTIEDEEHLKIVQHAMWRVVNDANAGTAAGLRKINNMVIAGKTGTAQVYSLDAGKSQKKSLQDHALFISYAPYKNPEIVVVVIVEHGGGGSSTAAPIAHKIIKKYVSNKETVAQK